MNSNPLVGTHIHTVFSPGDGMSDIKALFQYVKDNEMPGIFITDHGNVYHIPEAIRLSKEMGVEYAPGCELYFTTGDHLDDQNGDTYHLLVYPITQEGYHNFLHLVSEAGIDKRQVKRTKRMSSKEYERVDFPMLRKYGKGLAATSACLGGWIPQLLMQGKHSEAVRAVEKYKLIFDVFYLEVQAHENPDQVNMNKMIMELAQETNTPLIIAFDSHYILPKNKKAHDIYVKMDRGGDAQEYLLHMRNGKDVLYYCKKHGIPKEAIINTKKLFDMTRGIKLQSDDPNFFIPHFPTPKGYTETSYLTKISKEGVLNKAKENKLKLAPSKYLNQIDYEINQVISPKGFSGYFLILWDLIKEAKDRKILMGPGRGSAAGSTVSYMTNITKLDPIYNNFIFERFLTRERDEFPDIDTDISKEKRSEIIEYIADKYGHDKVTQLITFTYLKLKNIIKGVMKALDDEQPGSHPFAEANVITTKIPALIDGEEPSLKLYRQIADNEDEWRVRLGDSTYDKTMKDWERLTEFFTKYPEVYEVIEDLSGCVVSTGVHAGAVIVSRVPLAHYVPITSAKKGSAAVLPLVAFDMSGAAQFNLLKIDLLGLKTLTFLEEFMDITGIDYDWYESEDFSDPKVYETINKKYTADGFQIATAAAKGLLTRFRIESFEDFVAFVAGNRPGPLSVNPDTGESMMDKYLKAKDTGKVISIHPDIDGVIADTYGCIW